MIQATNARVSARLLLTLAIAIGGLSYTTEGIAAQPTSAAAGSCQLDPAHGQIKHVVEIQFDNVHLRRDDPNVPSDVEQMPNLYNFLKDNGTLLNNHHTPLISHTANDILTTLTGLYPDDHGQPVANTFPFYTPDGHTHTALSFAYWTDLAQGFDGTAEGRLNLLTRQQRGVPAPWVAFTRAGCDVGGVGTANIELERITNVPTVFGANSPEAAEAADTSDNGQARTTADFIGIAVHCATTSTLCASSNHGVADRLPDEPDGYSGFMGLFGHKYVGPQISPNGPLTDLDGKVIENVAPNGTTMFPGFPGFNGMSATVSLAYIAAMQEHGVPVTYAYISAAHELNDTGLGPGDAQYEQNLRSYDDAFGKFFGRLARDGINRSNTLFVVAADENDFFAGTPPQNPGCDGVTVPCKYDPNRLGSVEVGLDVALGQKGVSTPFDVHSDSAVGFYLSGNPAQSDQATRRFERAVSQISVLDPRTNRKENISFLLADRAEMNVLHMVTGDPNRTATFFDFLSPGFQGLTGGLDCSNDPTTLVMQCPGVETWLHGDIQPQITRTWAAFAGPGVEHRGLVDSVWSDHSDVRPTVLAAVGLRDKYVHDGRVLTEVLQDSHRRGDNDTFGELQRVFKQINAPVGRLALSTIPASTTAMKSGSASDDRQYARVDQQLESIADERDELASQITAILEGVAFNGRSFDEDRAEKLIAQSRALLERAASLDDRQE
jgi:hypothetical protein